MSDTMTAVWTKLTFGEGCRTDLWECVEPTCAGVSVTERWVATDDRETHRTQFHGPRDEAADCGQCNRPDQFAWDITYWVDGGPVITCREHGALAPGWAYMLTAEIGASHD